MARPNVRQKIVEAGTRIRSQGLALLASQGFAEAEIGGAVRAAIVSTGDELVAPGGKLGAGQIFESNSTLVHGLLEGWDPVRIARYANAAGAIVASRLACADAMPDLSEIEELLA